VHSHGQGLDRQGLGLARQTFQQDMAAGEQPHQQAFNQVLLADDHLGHLLAQEPQPAGAVPDLLVDGLDGIEGILPLLLTRGRSRQRRDDCRVRLNGHEDSCPGKREAQ
jgi:hypothetical protein